MNKANRVSVIRAIMSFIIMFILVFPFYDLGIKFPTYLYNGNILIDLKYIIVGILFLVASVTDFLNGYIAKKNNNVTDYGKMLDSIANRILINPALIVLACSGMISPIIAVAIITRDIIVDALKTYIVNKNQVVPSMPIARFKTVTLMIGIILTLFYNMPFEIVKLNISDFLLIIAAILAVISGVKYYMLAKKYFVTK